jgi:transposase
MVKKTPSKSQTALTEQPTASEVQEVIQELLDEDTFIQNIQQVIEECQSRQQLAVKAAFIRKQLAEMGISYRKVKHVNFQANSERCLVVGKRVRYARMGMKKI